MEKKLLATAAKLASETFGGACRLQFEGGDVRGRATVRRLRVVNGPMSAPETMIAKMPPRWGDDKYDPDKTNVVSMVHLNEWAGLRFVTEIGGESLIGPRFYASDREQGVILMEDFGEGRRLDHDLCGDNAKDAEATLYALMRALGRMHAQSAGNTHRYVELRRSLGPILDRELFSRASSSRSGAFREQIARIGAKPARGFYKELEDARRMWNAPGPFEVYVHYDPCPDNCHWVGDELKLLDFARGRVAPAVVDGCYPRIHFPTCWCVSRLPEEVWRSAEEVYRAELAVGCPEANDNALFCRWIAVASARWAFTTAFHWAMPEAFDKDSQWGLVTVRQRTIFRFELVASTMDEFGLMPAVGETARRIAARLRDLWPDVEEMPLYPALREDKTT